MRILIVGAGATGGFLAARLSQAGHAVSVIARGAHLKAMQQNGLTLRLPSGPPLIAHMPASENLHDLGPQDLVITTVKSPALPSILKSLKSLIDSEVPIVTAMNGVFWWYGWGNRMSAAPEAGRLDPDGQISKLFHDSTPYGMVVHSTNEVISPGIVMNRSKKNRFVVGGPTADSATHVRAIFEQLNALDTKFEVAEDIRYHMWRKLLRNLTTAPISVLTGAKAYDVINDPDARHVSRLLFEEGAEVAASHGYPELAEDVDAVFSPGSGADQRPSMAQDIDKGRPLEIDSMLRVVQDFARQKGIKTPALDHIIGLVILRARLAECYP